MRVVALQHLYHAPGSAVAVACLRGVAALALILLSAGCANSPFATEARRDDDIVTGSLRTPTAYQPQTQALAYQPMPLPRPPGAPMLLERGDQEAIGAALKTALLDQERAATVPWLDEKSGHGGVISAVGARVARADGLCRAVVVSVQRGQTTSWVQGNACRANVEDWRLDDVQSWTNPS